MRADKRRRDSQLEMCPTCGPLEIPSRTAVDLVAIVARPSTQGLGQRTSLRAEHNFNSFVRRQTTMNAPASASNAGDANYAHEYEMLFRPLCLSIGAGVWLAVLVYLSTGGRVRSRDS